MTIIELTTLTESRLQDLLGLMQELDPEIPVSAEILRQAVENPYTHVFAAEAEGGEIIGTASLCVFSSPTGKKAHVEDVVVSQAHRGEHIGRLLMEHLIGYARKELGRVDIHLTSRPHRVAANALYRSLGFQFKETNVYVLKLA